MTNSMLRCTELGVLRLVNVLLIFKALLSPATFLFRLAIPFFLISSAVFVTESRAPPEVLLEFIRSVYPNRQFQALAPRQNPPRSFPHYGPASRILYPSEYTRQRHQDEPQSPAPKSGFGGKQLGTYVSKTSSSSSSFHPFFVSASGDSYIVTQQRPFYAPQLEATMATKHFFPDTHNLVVRGLESLVAKNPHLSLDAPNKVVYLPSHSSSKVSVLSGGGAGHEPAWCGYVGHGLLSAAISGEVFASPSTKQIMAAVEKVPSDKGAILCITNYTGDNLHFGLAREKVAGAGRKVGMLRMTDDVGLGREKTSKLGRRGLAGNMFGECKEQRKR